ncbi:biosynthetic arginine decarboxylase [Desulfoluna butyratoxydans]|uniref:Biosynthetic arginine decarboxylase n=1 Tax=Desulfoluna butyratoxydans TaxID=231438 RepID=A0A4U8YQP7_9BACT|nr:biosynthetic arginine decarboxylase [Desulfoluna butyratoxydans]VFQ46576.1 arginine decarboxylase [Desulfoluna butyratoxydans]
MKDSTLFGKDKLERWTIEDSADVYGIRNWGSGYFDISEDGQVEVIPDPNAPDKKIRVLDVISGIRARGREMPVLLRIENILDSQIAHLHTSFQKAIDDFRYQGAFRGVYPIKVNQQMEVVEEVTQFGRQYHHGLEAGSKAELIAALSFLTDPEACLICNGYKDEEFVDLALWATKMGLNCFLVVEMPEELELIMRRAEALDTRPNLGVRIKLASRAGGHWTESGGDRSIFGLNTTQVVALVDRLKETEMLDCLKLLHYHLGSQIPNIRDIRSAVLEACRIYAGLSEEGAAMGYLDLGGGLAVDYDGSHTNFASSRNYSIDEYCADIIETVMGVMDDQELAHPTIVTESGRATVAYYSMLLFNILDVGRLEPQPFLDEVSEETPDVIISLMEVLQGLTLKNIQECFNDAIYYRDEVRQRFKHGELNLRERSMAENIFWHIIHTIARKVKHLKRVPKELEGIEEALADIYYANFSVFQSLPDAWAIGHLFPTMPMHRLNEMPTRHGVIADITCDCDGKLDRFIDPHGVRNTLPLHELRENEEYYLGVFLVGAYQETLGDLHNLFGDTNVVSIRMQPDGTVDYVKEVSGDSVADVLEYVEYNPRGMLNRFRRTAEAAIRNGQITVEERYRIMQAYENGLQGYTYFER